MNDLQKEESWYSIKELAEGKGVHQETIKKNIRDIFGKSIDTVRKIQIKGKSRTYYYNELAKNELMKKLARNQLNQGKNHSTGKQAVKGVISNSINENNISILLRQNQEQLKLRDKIHENIALLSDVIRNRELLYDVAIRKAKEVQRCTTEC